MNGLPGIGVRAPEVVAVEKEGIVEVPGVETRQGKADRIVGRGWVDESGVGDDGEERGFADGEIVAEEVGSLGEWIASEEGFVSAGAGEIAAVEIAAAGVKGCRVCAGFVGENGEARDGEDRDGRGFGDAFSSGEADTDAGEAPGPVGDDDGGDGSEGNVLGGEEVANGRDELCRVGFSGDFGLGEEVEFAGAAASQSHGAERATGVDPEKHAGYSVQRSACRVQRSAFGRERVRDHSG